MGAFSRFELVSWFQYKMEVKRGRIYFPTLSIGYAKRVAGVGVDALGRQDRRLARRCTGRDKFFASADPGAPRFHSHSDNLLIRR